MVLTRMTGTKSAPRVTVLIYRLALVAIALAVLARGTDPLFAGTVDVPCPMASHDSDPMPQVTCCDEMPAPVAPPPSPQAAPGRSLEPSALDHQLAARIQAGEPPTALFRPAAPPHDWRRLDLSVFLSVFLI
jgi:hypothetical protein